MSTLPIELVVEILARLPVKSLLRFKCVNKTWQSLISDPKFANLQLKRSNASQNILLATCPPQSVDFKAFQPRKLNYPAILARGHPQDSYVGIQGSCNGLVCLLDDNDQMFIWNPTTGDCSRIPNPNVALYGVFLHGIGYNRSTDNYGVIFGSRNGTRDTIIELFTLGTRNWRRIRESDLIPPKSFDLGSGISWNGDLYWISIRGSVYTVICFDMVDEEFKEILPLPDIDMDISTVNLGIYEKYLCVFVECNESSFEGLILKIEGNKVSYNRLFRYPHNRFAGYGNKALCLTNNGKVLMDSDGWEVYSYDPKLRKCSGSLYLHHETESESVLYQESLVSPNEGNT